MTSDGGFGVYVHWPFCTARCPYCDFNAHVRPAVDQAAYATALSRELGHYASRTRDAVVGSIFFGGGTPSLMNPDTVATVIDSVAQHWPMAADTEITLEANPTSVEASRFAGYAAAGVNRVSLGVQALNEEDLRRLGRLHTVAEARAAFDIARSRFDRVSFDLIYARQDQTLASWRAELTSALEMAIDHLSLYQLTIEDGTAFGDRHRRGRLPGLPNPDLGADLYDLTQQLCGAAGLPAYEISNHARPGAASRHNLVYWRYGSYVGIGPGAHGRFVESGRRMATEALRQPERWLAAALSDGHGRSSETIVPPEAQGEEYLMMALRLEEGASLSRYEALCGSALAPEQIEAMVAEGMIERDLDRIRATAAGRPVLNAVLAALLS